MDAGAEPGGHPPEPADDRLLVGGDGEDARAEVDRDRDEDERCDPAPAAAAGEAAP